MRLSDKGRVFVLSSVVFVGVSLLYFQTKESALINFDDDVYVYRSPTTNGLSIASIQWAFTGAHIQTSNWHPLTMLSLLFDVTLAGGWQAPILVHELCDGETGYLGPRPTGGRVAALMHLHNLFLHGVDGVLVFWLLILLLEHRMTLSDGRDVRPGVCWIAFVAAAFWAWHPLRVESVAWVASRKDVLCLFWYLLGHLVYLKELRNQENTQTGGSKGLGVVIACVAYIFAFMAKPTAIVYPCTLFLLESSLAVPRDREKEREAKALFYGIMFLLAGVMAIVTLQVQAGAMTMGSPLMVRLMNAVASMGDYFRSTLLPSKLCLFYPYDDDVPFGRFFLGLFVCGFFFLVGLYPFVRQCRGFLKTFGEKRTVERIVKAKIFVRSERSALKENHLLMIGSVWFLITLVPVLGVVQVGMASHADRYTYLSGIGLSIMLVAVMSRSEYLGIGAKCRCFWKMCLGCAVFGVSCYLVWLSLQTVRYVKQWVDEVTLYTYALSVSPGNPLVHGNLAVYYYYKQDYATAMYHRKMQSAWLPQNTQMRSLEGTFIMLKRQEGLDVKLGDPALEIVVDQREPRAADKYYAQGYIAYRLGLYASAEQFVLKCLEQAQEDGIACELYAKILEKNEHFEEAKVYYQRAFSHQPYKRSIVAALKRLQHPKRESPLKSAHSLGFGDDCWTWQVYRWTDIYIGRLTYQCLDRHSFPSKNNGSQKCISPV